jgi:hypothetical protein
MKNLLLAAEFGWLITCLTIIQASSNTTTHRTSISYHIISYPPSHSPTPVHNEDKGWGVRQQHLSPSTPPGPPLHFYPRCAPNMNIDQVQKIIQCPPRDRSRSRASTAATTSLKRSREADDTLSRRLKTPPVGGPGLPARNKMTKTVSVPALSLSKPDDSAVSTAKTTHVALTRPFTVAVAVPGASSSTPVGNHVDDDAQHAIPEGLPDLIDVDSPQEWVRSQAQNKRKRSRSGDGQAGLSRHCGQQNISSPSTSSRLEPKSPYNTRRKNGNYNSAMSTTRNASQARPATQCSGISIDDAIEVMSSASTDSSSADSSSTDSSGVEVLEDKCIWVSGSFPRMSLNMADMASHHDL